MGGIDDIKIQRNDEDVFNAKALRTKVEKAREYRREQAAKELIGVVASCIGTAVDREFFSTKWTLPIGLTDRQLAMVTDFLEERGFQWQKIDPEEQSTVGAAVRPYLDISW